MTGDTVKMRLLIEQMPEVGRHSVVLREVKVLGAVTTSAVALAGKEEPRVKGEVTVSVMFEF